jgi:hypothetical protein
LLSANSFGPASRESDIAARCTRVPLCMEGVAQSHSAPATE